jgi:superfamily I DNA/RNA helicase
MLLVQALAGTGKTTTSVFGLGKKVPKGMILSDEQKEIVKAMRVMKYKTCAAMAFNRSIASVLQERTRDIPGVEAATSNAFGNRAWTEFLGSRPKVDGNKNRILFRELAGQMSWKEKTAMEGPVAKLVSLCKCNLLEPTNENLVALCDEFDEEVDLKVFDFVEKVYQKGVETKNMIDYDDQLFMPIYYDIPLKQFDIVLVDELQDLNRAKQELAFRLARLGIVGVGDEHQAIYGFSGADSQAMGRFGVRMQEAVLSYLKDESGSTDFGMYGYRVLPLTMTRRCPKEIVRVANKYVPEFRATDDAPDGEVLRMNEGQMVSELISQEEGKMVLCRTNAPLASLAFKLIAEDRRCYIQGKDIGVGIKRDVERTKEQDLKIAVVKACEMIEKKISDLTSRPFPNESKIDALRDRINCIQYISQGCETLKNFMDRVDSLFQDAGLPNDIQLSTVHKAKGLEHKNVVIYKPSKLPLIISGKGRKVPKFQVQQEYNLAYVAYTRSMDKLIFAEEESAED